jgi:hypothetical protein
VGEGLGVRAKKHKRPPAPNPSDVPIDQQTRQVAQELQELAQMSASIGGILQTIEEIARQTNLLALERRD